MAQVVEVRGSPASLEAETWAPQAHAHALQLESQAERAFEQGDAASASILAEHAIAAHEHAWVLTRLARAERRRLEAEGELADQRRVLAELHAQHQRLTAEAAGLELRTQVARGALPLPPHEAAEPVRAQARRRAAGALATQGRILCVSARLLGERDGVEALMSELDQLDGQLSGKAGANVLETATRLRSECLRLLTSVRRQHGAATGRVPSPEALPGAGPAVGAEAAGPADSLLAELSSAGAEPSRDDRGVSVALRNAFASDGSLTDAARAVLGRLSHVATTHPDFPVLLIGHAGSPVAPADAERRLATVSAELARLGVSRVEARDAGQRLPLLPDGIPSARERNERIELVFVAPVL